MKTICRLTALMLLVSLQLSYSQPLPLSITDNGFIFVDVTINDTVKSKFLFDTGGGLTVLSGKLYEKIKATTKPGGIFTGFRHDGGRLDAELFSIPSLSMGSITQKNVAAGVYPPLDEYGIEGIISLKTIENHPVIIDLKNKTLTIIDKEALKDLGAVEIPIKLISQLDIALDMFIPLCINGSVTVDAEFDTGSGYDALLLNPYYMKSLGIDSSASEKREYRSPVNGTVTIDRMATLSAVELCGSLTLVKGENIRAVFREKIIYQGLVGSGMFKDRAFVIDIPGKRLLVLK